MKLCTVTEHQKRFKSVSNDYKQKGWVRAAAPLPFYLFTGLVLNSHVWLHGALGSLGKAMYGDLLKNTFLMKETIKCIGLQKQPY